jgi:two-component system, sensor histidine kinase PdtaS
VSALSDLLTARTELTEPQVDHLQRLVGEWQLLSDLSFADLLLWVPVSLLEGDAGTTTAFLCAAQCRPTTGPTAYQHDQVGAVQRGERALPLRIALRERRTYREGEPDWDGDLPIRREAIPVRVDGEVIAVLGKDANLASIRTPSQLELVYLQSAADLSAMIADGTFPNPNAGTEEAAGPRVGDGLMRLEPDGTIIYASPNALSALNRLGVTGVIVGEPVDELTSTVADDPFDASDLAEAITTAIDGGQPASIEVDGGGAIILFRALPLRPREETLGALLLMQDVTELRRRDRQILSKDATIREIHHRVKNNLQTVAALLRLQARRTAIPEARRALQESVRRVNSIALVHESLSASVAERVDLDELVDKVLPAIGDGATADVRAKVRRDGSFGTLSAALATPLVLVLTELVHNALAHAFDPGTTGEVVVTARRSGGNLDVKVSDDGNGLPPGFDIDASAGLGLSIVRTLLESELDSTLCVRPRPGGGTEAVITLSLRGR